MSWELVSSRSCVISSGTSRVSRSWGGRSKCDVGRVDIAGRGADGATVVDELKVGEAKDSAIGQIARYMGWHQQQQGAGTVRGIVASDLLEGVQYAALAMPNLALRRYRIQLTFADASL